ncbi:MAG TPA: hypothetical protein VN914_13545 [Polyangia bacterium]|nr:hypothetical protein [Polyangia bacterium]
MSNLARLGVLGLGGLLVATCYKPDIIEGGLRCSPSFECPEGFKCNSADALCYRTGTIPPVGGTGGTPTGGSSGSGGAGGMCTAGTQPYGPFAGCTPPGGMGCDVVCQSGCACNERCKLVGGNATCAAEGPTFIQHLDSCEPKDDKCRPGTICLQESPDHPACGAHCYRHCRTDADCTNAKCTIEVQFGNSATTNKVCSPPMDACNPFGPARCSPSSNRPYPTFACYVMSSSYPDIPICDCAGTTPAGSPCTYEHECEPGAECVLLGSVRACRKVCKVGAPPATPVMLGGCPAVNPTCTAFPGGSQFGYCH